MKTQIKLWTIYALFILSLLITLRAGAQSSENSIYVNRIDYAEDVPPTVTIMQTDLDRAIKLCVDHVQSRAKSIIEVNYADNGAASAYYVVDYQNGEYLVTFWWNENGIFDKLDQLQTSGDDNIIYRSTRVIETREWLRSELKTFYDHEYFDAEFHNKR